jgi:hypothetical protein
MSHRRTMRAVTTAAAAGVAFTLGAAAQANPMDLAPERLTQPCTAITQPVAVPCGGAAFSGTNLVTNYVKPDNDAWAKLMSQYGMAFAPTAMHPARTTGYGGFELSWWGTITSISHDEDFMKKGTEGPINNNKFSNRNDSPDSVIQVYGVTGRKGLPYGFEIQGSAGYVANTELTVLGGGIRFAPFEGFRTGFLGGIPDLSVGAYVNTVAGTSKVKLTVPALDVQLSKPITIASQVILQPYLGWQMVWIDADSGVIDGTPKNDGLAGCNARPPTPAEQKAGDPGEFHCQTFGSNGQAQDAAGNTPASNAKLDLNNNMVFKNIRFRRQRAMLGVSIRYEIAHLLLHFATDIADPEAGGDDRIKGLAKQWTFGVTTGVHW